MDENFNLSLTKDSRLFSSCSMVVRDFHASVTYGEKKGFFCLCITQSMSRSSVFVQFDGLIYTKRRQTELLTSSHLFL